MRIRTFESDDLNDLIRKHNLKPDDFSFVKKRGHMHVHPMKGEPFIFFREKQTRINAEGRWEDDEVFFLSYSHKQPLDSWREVLDAFDLWLEGYALP